jgi:hypothetical protein
MPPDPTQRIGSQSAQKKWFELRPAVPSRQFQIVAKVITYNSISSVQSRNAF